MNKLLERLKLDVRLTNREVNRLSPVSVIMVIIAAVLFAVSLIISAPAAVHIVLYVVAACIAGFELVIDSINAIEDRNYFAPALLYCLTAVVAFILGFASEAAALLIVYRLGLIVLAYVDDKSRKSAVELLAADDEETVAHLEELIREKQAERFPLAETLSKSAERILRFAMIFAVLCVFLLPFLGGFSYRVSVHRALMVLILCTPLSVAASMPLVGVMGLAFSARQGAVFNSAAAMQRAAEANAAAFDMAGVFSMSEPRLLGVQSELVDKKTFMNFVAHAAYYSEQPFAHAIASAYGQDYRLDVVSDFAEIPGSGVELKIAGNPVLMATASVFAERGIQIPQDQPENGQAYYVQIAGRYVGRVVISNAISEEGRTLVEEIQDGGIRRCLLFTETGGEESQQLSEALGFQEVYSECDTEKKLHLISDLCEEGKNRLLYIYANGFEAHSDADVDLRISKKAKYADAHLPRENVMELPFVLQICRRMCELAKENAVIVMVVKAILIFLSLTGYSSLWFVVFVDMAAAIAAQLNAARITTQSLIKSFASRRG